LGNEVMAAAEKIAVKYGIEVKRGSGKYDSNEYKMNNVTFFVPSGSGSGMIPSKENRLMVNWNMNRGGLGLAHVDVGDVFKNYKGEDIKLVGWDTKKRKYPVLYENLTNGKQYKSAPMNFKNQINFG